MIQRRTPLCRSSKPLKRTPLRKVSKKKRQEMAYDAVQCRAFKKAHPYCEAKILGVCTGHTQDRHHVFGRGKYMHVQSTWLPVCRACHRYIHDHPGTARTMNLLK